MNYLTLQGRVEDELNRSDMSTRIQSWISEARNEIADGTIPILASPTQGVHKFSWCYSSAAVSTSTMNNSWPTDFMEEISFFETSAEKPLVKLDPVYFDQLLYSETGGTYSLTTTGTPTNYIDRGTSYDLFPTPSGAVELYLRYYAYPIALTNQEDEYTIDTKVPSLIIAATCLKAARLLHDVDLINIFKQYAQEYYAAAVNKDRSLKWKNRQLRVKTYGDFDISHWKGIHQIGDYPE
jgi:hypothetical protein